MATLKIEFKQVKAKADGRFPIYIRCTVGTRIARYYLESAHPGEWDPRNKRIVPRSRKDYAKINMHIENEFNRFETEFIRLKNTGETFDPADVFVQTERKAGRRNYTFFEVADLYLAEVEKKNSFTHSNFSFQIQKFRNFIQNDRFRLKDFDMPLIRAYIAWLGEKGNSLNTIRHSIKTLKIVANFSQVNDYGDKPAAFLKIKLPARTPSNKPKLTVDEVRAIATLQTAPGSKQRAAQQAFLFAIYMRGMRISDVLQLKADQFIGGQFSYTMQKVKTFMEMRVPAKARPILNEFSAAGTPYLFPFLKYRYEPALDKTENARRLMVCLKNATIVMNRYLGEVAAAAGIQKKVTTHIARHTFGKRITDIIPDRSVTMELMGHKSMSVHENYIRELNKTDTLDEAAEDLF